MSACVLPIAPEFQDPPSAPNYAPVFLAVEPPIGTVVVVTASNPQASFTVTVQDPNATDDLYVRFIVDYPLFTVNTRTIDMPQVVHRPDGKLLNQDVTFKPSCVSPGLAVGLPRHQIMAVVADRPFDKTMAPGQPVDLTRVEDSGQKVIATWTLELECK